MVLDLAAEQNFQKKSQMNIQLAFLMSRIANYIVKLAPTKKVRPLGPTGQAS